MYGCVCVCVVEMRKKGIEWVQNGMGSEWNGFRMEWVQNGMGLDHEIKWLVCKNGWCVSTFLFLAQACFFPNNSALS